MSHEETKSPKESIETVDNETFFRNDERRTRLGQAINTFVNKASMMMSSRHDADLYDFLEGIFNNTLESRNFRVNVSENIFNIGDIDLIKDDDDLDVRHIVETDISLESWKVGKGTFGITLEMLFIILESQNVDFDKNKWDGLFESGGKGEEVDQDEAEQDIFLVDTNKPPKLPYRYARVCSTNNLGLITWDSYTYKDSLVELSEEIETGDELMCLEADTTSFLPSSVADWLLLHQEQIPEKWKKYKKIFFLGTIFMKNDTKGYVVPETDFVVFLQFEGRWILSIKSSKDRIGEHPIAVAVLSEGK